VIVAVEVDSSGHAHGHRPGRTPPRLVGCALVESRPRSTEETETDLFGEQAVSGVVDRSAVQYGFEVLTEAG